MRPCAVSTRKILPGCSRSLSTMFSGGMSSTPTSDAMIDEVVVGHVVARRPQAVAVEHRADHRAVGEGDRRRTVPRLHQRRVVLVERLPVGIDRRVAAPGLRDHHQDGVRQRAPGHDEELEHVVEGGRVAAALADDREDLAQVLAELRRLSRPSRARIQLMLPRSVLISPLCAMKRYGCASGQDGNVFVLKRWCTSASAESHVGIGQIGEQRRDLVGRQHALVDERARREADDVEEVLLGSVRRSTSCSIRLRATYSLRSKRRRSRSGSASKGKCLPRPTNTCWNDRLRRHRARAEQGSSVGTSRHPSSCRSSSSRMFCDQRLDRAALGTVARQEHEAGAVVPLVGQLDAERAVTFRRKRSGICIRMPAPSPVLASQPHAPRCSRLTSSCSPCSMTSCERRPLTLTTKPDAAGVLLVLRMVEALRAGRLCACVRSWSCSPITRPVLTTADRRRRRAVTCARREVLFMRQLRGDQEIERSHRIHARSA